eukprot:6564712-Pyramimonas_sp.AAC.1
MRHPRYTVLPAILNAVQDGQATARSSFNRCWTSGDYSAQSGMATRFRYFRASAPSLPARLKILPRCLHPSRC